MVARAALRAVWRAQSPSVAKLSVRSMNRKHVMKVILVDKVLHVILFSWMIEIYVKLNTGYLLWQDKFRIRNSS